MADFLCWIVGRIKETRLQMISVSLLLFSSKGDSVEMLVREAFFYVYNFIKNSAETRDVERSLTFIETLMNVCEC